MKKVLALGAAVAVSSTIAYSAEAASHTVESGDSLWALAEGNNVTVESIKKENKLTSDIIVPGQVLEIDGKEEVKEDKEAKEAKEDKEETDVYIIKAGDTLFEIGVEFDATVAELKEWNNLSSDLIFEGKELIVSGESAIAAAPVEEAPAVEEVEEAAPAQEAAPAETENNDYSYQTEEETYEEPAQQEPVQQQVQEPKTQNVSTSTNTNSGLNWGALAACESGGNPSVVSSNGLYHGLYQFDAQTWQSVGGSGVASDASAAEQTQRAQTLYNQRGSSPWPVCGARL